MSVTTKPVNQKAWFLILPVLICVAFSAIMPLMTVVNYSVQDIISPTQQVFVGTEWFSAIMRDEELHGALLRQLTFSMAVLAVELPLGIMLALAMPSQGWKSSAVLVIVSLDPDNTAECELVVDLGALGLAPDAPLNVRDELSGATFTWGQRNFVRLTPAQPAHILHVL